MIRFRAVCSTLVLASVVAVTSACASRSVTVPADHVASRSANATSSVIKPGDAGCLQDTGSHIPAKRGECLPATGRSYSAEELQRTGTQDTARGLQNLDPSIRVGH